MSPITIANINVTSQTLSSLLSDIASSLSTKEPGIKPIFSINPEIVVQAHENLKLKEILNTGWRNIPDGIGILWAARLQGEKIAERVTGVALTKELLKYAEGKKLRVGIVGPTEKNAEKIKKYLFSYHPSLSYSIRPLPYFPDANYHASTQNIEKWLSSKDGGLFLTELKRTRILFVALGAPKQEFFINYLQRQTPNGYRLTPNALITVAVGGTFDELTEIVPQAPNWIESIGMKWLFRLATEPWRWKRQLRLIKFIFLSLHS